MSRINELQDSLERMESEVSRLQRDQRRIRAEVSDLKRATWVDGFGKEMQIADMEDSHICNSLAQLGDRIERCDTDRVHFIRLFAEELQRRMEGMTAALADAASCVGEDVPAEPDGRQAMR